MCVFFFLRYDHDVLGLFVASVVIYFILPGRLNMQLFEREFMKVSRTRVIGVLLLILVNDWIISLLLMYDW